MPMSPEEIWRRFQETPAPYNVVDFPRKSKDEDPKSPTFGQMVPIARLGVRILRQEEAEDAFAAAEREVQQKLSGIADPTGKIVNDGKPIESQGYVELRKLHSARQILHRACYFLDDNEKITDRPFFPTPQHVRQFLTPAEVGVLSNAYYRTTSELGPIVAHMTTDQQLGLIKQLAVGGRLTPLDSLSWVALIDLILTLVSLVASSTTATSSAGSPPAPPSTETEESTAGSQT